MLHIHENGMIHRDLKFENVMLIDFGLAHVDAMKDTMPKGVGAFAYMSPEMANEDDYNNKTDVYSFLLLVLFTRRFQKLSMKEKPAFRVDFAAQH
ncbi:hypothetical protein M9Y10_040072 [Tritrichomonas musculus]|uniref:Protein kinase domain-containing protein n=1 Tax=Tritrichomonas musculus TaxID=1915356 RepID=A0ABR2GQ99_9EUKA